MIVGALVAPLTATRADAPLTMSGRDDNTSKLSAAQALVAINAPLMAVHDATRRQSFLFMPTSQFTLVLLLTWTNRADLSATIASVERTCLKASVYLVATSFGTWKTM
jgi:hypothetical protein